LIRSSRARQVLLGLTALVFLGIAAASLAHPHFMAQGLGYRLYSVDALSEFRAVYVGLWTATALLLVFALVRVEQPAYGDLGALLVLGQVAGRLLSLLVDGWPSGRVWPMFVLEGLGAAALFLVRPSRGAR
jgi:hypothetical protein